MGKYKDCLNIVDEKGNIENIDWKSMKQWKRDLTDSDRVFILQNNTNVKEIKEAKVKELNSWKQNGVYEEVDYRNQKLISTRWVLSEKMKDGKTITKARLVAGGFEEQKNDTSVNDSTTFSKEVLRVSLATFLSQSWSFNSIDIKSAFLQGKEINRQVYLKPPKDFAREEKYGYLRKCLQTIGCIQILVHESKRRISEIKCESFKI